MKKWLFPIASSILWTFLVIFIFCIGVGGNGDGSGFFGVIVALFCIILCCIIVMPTVCFMYSRYCLLDQKYRFLFTLYQSFLITLPYLILFFEDNETFLYSFILFVWCELWSLIGLIKFKRKNQNKLNWQIPICRTE